MCLYIKRTFKNTVLGPQSHIAKEDITCYKIYKKVNDTQVNSIFQNTTHNLGKQPKVKIGVRQRFDLDNPIQIHEGYHSYVDLKTAVKRLNESYSVLAMRIFECKIPKGTRYYKGIHSGDENYVSETIVIEKEFTPQDIKGYRQEQTLKALKSGKSMNYPASKKVTLSKK